MQLNLDLSYLRELSGDDKDFIATILTTFLEESVKDIEKIEQAVASKDISSIGKLAHKNKSTLQLLGLSELKQLAFDIEQAAKKDTENTAVVTGGADFVKYLKDVNPIVSTELEKLMAS